jgi:hypothetical protein
LALAVFRLKPTNFSSPKPRFSRLLFQVLISGGRVGSATAKTAEVLSKTSRENRRRAHDRLPVISAPRGFGTALHFSNEGLVCPISQKSV